LSNDHSPQDLAAAEAMVGEMKANGLDIVKVSAIAAGYEYDERGLEQVSLGVTAGVAAALEWLRRHDAICTCPRPPDG
jgi:hypothetical protein